MKSTINGSDFNRLIGAVRSFAEKTDVRPMNRLIQFHFNADTTSVTAYAVDGYRAAKERAVCYTVDEDFTVLVSAPPLKANGRIGVEVELDGDCAYISYGDVRFRTKQPEGDVFNVQKVISDAMERKEIQRFGANVDYLMDALKSLKASGATGRKPIIVEFRGPSDPIILRTDSDNPKMVLPVRIKREEECRK